MALKGAFAERAGALGFDALRVATLGVGTDFTARLRGWIEAGHHADMAWMAEGTERRGAPQRLWAEARSAVVLGLSAAPDGDPLALTRLADRGAVATYAQRRDYHDVIKGKLKELAGFLAAKAGADVKVFVDTAPLMEKPLAQAAGLGWQGKHSVLVSRDLGPWLLLGVILTTAELPPDAPARDHCGSCRRCLDICPTDAFPAPYALDSRRCIAYLTIEHHGPIDRALRPLIGNRVFGCDDCLAVCPWNKFAKAGREAKIAAREDLAAPPLRELARLDDTAFRQRFAGTPIKRTGRDRFLRNVLIAIGNSGDPALAAEAERCLLDPAPVVRGAAVWALSRLVPPARFAGVAARFTPIETDPDVREEWEAALALTKAAA